MLRDGGEQSRVAKFALRKSRAWRKLSGKASIAVNGTVIARVLAERARRACYTAFHIRKLAWHAVNAKYTDTIHRESVGSWIYTDAKDAA